MSLIDQSYFQSELAVAGLSSPAVSANFDRFISKYEKKILRRLLGDQYSDFKTAIAIDPIPEPWNELVNGNDDWMGLVNEDKQSIIANYIYYYWNANLAYQSTSIGTVVPKAENATVVGPARQMVRAWNEMIEWIDDFDHYMRDNSDLYPGCKSRGCEDREYLSPINIFNL